MERLRNHGDFVAVMRSHRKVSSPAVVVHYRMRSIDSIRPGVHGRRLGLAVSKAVGGAVTRNRVKRRFRVIAHAYEDKLPQGCDVVMRALPSCSRTSFQDLDRQVSALFTTIGRRISRSGSPRTGDGITTVAVLSHP